MKKYLPFRIFFCILAIAGFIWFYIPVLHSVLNIGNLSGIIACSILFLFSIFYPLIEKECRSSRWIRVGCRIFAGLIFAGILWTAVLTGLIISGMNNKPPESATVVVLGSQVKGHAPSADLMERINAAGDYLAVHPKANCIVSGGRGEGELETEAAVMKQYLVQKGIASSRIQEEDKSTTTQQNLEYSLHIINRAGMNRNLAIVTDEYHQYRAGRAAKNYGGIPHAVCAKTPWYIFSACYAQETLALTKYLILP